MKGAVLFIACTLSLFGCKHDNEQAAGTGKVASCLSESLASCREYRDANLALGSDSLAKLCTVVDHTAKFTDAPCPTAKLIGSCAKPEGKDFYYEGYFEAVPKIADTCKQSGGTFTKQ